MNLPAVNVESLSHHYGERRALDDLSLRIEMGEIFAVLGPNGGGKTTLFRLLTTLLPIQKGEISVLGHDLRGRQAAVQMACGVVFQAPSVDKKLTVSENMRQQAALYGVAGGDCRARSRELLEHFGLADRARDRVESLSGGLRRRLELAKALIHRPRLLLLDEPSAGVDPAARIDLWRRLESLRREEGVTVALTSHLLEEADKADRVAILDRGRLVALGTPSDLRASVGGDCLTLEVENTSTDAAALESALGLAPTVVEGRLRIEAPEGHALITKIFETLPGRVRHVEMGRPSLEDVFIARTGREFHHADTGGAEGGAAS